jgi:hypothetical protein
METYPALRREFAHSCGEKLSYGEKMSRTLPRRFQTVSMVLSDAVRIMCLGLAKTCSMGEER